jgi:hypothetical protein
LALLTGRVLAFPEQTRLIHHQHAITLAELFNDVVAKDVANCIRTPLCPLEKVLRLIGRGFADPLRAASRFCARLCPANLLDRLANAVAVRRA